MDIRLEVGLMAAVASAIVAWVTARLTLRNELTKLQLTAQSSVFTRLLEARIVPYLSLYSELSDLIKELETNRVTSAALEERASRIDRWDSANAILLGARTTNVCWKFRATLRKALTVLGAAASNARERQATLSDLFDAASDLELSLRADLGIYGLAGVAPKAKIRTPVVGSYVAGEAT